MEIPNLINNVPCVSTCPFQMHRDMFNHFRTIHHHDGQTKRDRHRPHHGNILKSSTISLSF